MKNKQDNKFLSFIKKHRVLTLTLFLFLILLPFILIPSVYVYQITSSKDVIFEDKNNKALKVDKQNYFDIDFSLYTIVEPTEDEDGYYEFNYKISPKEGRINPLVDIKFDAQLSVANDKYTSHTENLNETLESTDHSKLRVKFNYDMNKSILPFMKPKGPNLYLVIYFTEIIADFGNHELRTIFVEVPYN